MGTPPSVPRRRPLAIAEPRARALAANLSALQLARRDIVDVVKAAVADSGLPAQLLTLELTETALIDPRHTPVQTSTTSESRLRLALDDFGTGYASLAALKRFPIDLLKIDRSFVGGLGSNPDRRDHRPTLALARTLDLHVVAEGIETDAQLGSLRAHGCHLGQGFLFAAPMHTAAFDGYLRQPRMQEPDEQVAHCPTDPLANIMLSPAAPIRSAEPADRYRAPEAEHPCREEAPRESGCRVRGAHHRGDSGPAQDGCSNPGRTDPVSRRSGIGSGQSHPWRRKHLAGADLEDVGDTRFVPEGAVAHLVLPVAVVLRLLHCGKRARRRFIGGLLGPSLDDYVKAGLPAVVAGCERALVIGAEVDGLLLAGTGAEVERAIAPHRRKRRDVRTPVGAHRRDPEQLGRFEDVHDVRPGRRPRAGGAEAGVEIGCRSRRWDDDLPVSCRARCTRRSRSRKQVPRPTWGSARASGQALCALRGGLALSTRARPSTG